jgi:K+-transporting ATPase ATPase A chain
LPANDLITLVVFAATILLITPVLGRYIAKVMEGERTVLSPVLRPIERGVYRVCGIDETVEQGWKGYTISVLVMALFAIVVGYIMLRLQDVLPLNPGAAMAQTPDLAFNTSVSFETNTNWQNYAGETGASYLIRRRSRRPQLHLRGDRLVVAIALSVGLTAGALRRSGTTGST